MKKIGILIMAVFPLLGCQTTGPKTYTGNTQSIAATNSKSCSFDQITGKAYLIAPDFKKYVTNSFFYDSEKETVWQLDKGNYSSLTSQKFKIVDTGLVTKEDVKSRQPYLSKYRYSEDDIKGIPYVRDKAFSSKLVTEDCSIYYLSGGTIIKSLLSSIVNTDGTKINEDDVLAFYGSEPLSKKSMDAVIEYDRFEKRLKVKTPYYDDMLIRGSLNAKDQSISLVQLYVDLTFFDKWGFISNAIDTDGVNHEVVKISTDTDCSNSDMFGCKLTETVGVTISEEFLNKHRDGFELKLFGTKEKIVKVSGYMVEGFLSGMRKAKEQLKSGDFGV
ncbi:MULTISPECIES: hypothetical protein [Pseudoalteromonas]|uniref:hypothetical protein n=1 Tax=Pseudoalteromonas TaxID=53246 RepID=UPI000FFF4BD8|nr:MULTISPECIES: hypothetical protein [Pseudoalteromonas]NKC18622.1 hypothetical protein [Pseudoalteromonas galatheae]RXE84849.1 hypothetical protein DRB05_17985 [Pseudoalteromonas sp. A757]